ncbi:hypothetical protein [Paenibacillus massiliensis]|uniref:hypothetical protein n=1 Tax=Paenibacillus massiliensis TaxID=225917 RepID=UPI0004708A2D|nr:hypothetical protein [Paenibacillus massiliensis]
MKKQSKLAIATLAISMLFATSAFGATANFSGNLPAKQGDTEISTVGRANASSSYKYFTIKVTSLGTGYTSVRAWTEGSWGGNYSDPYNEANLNASTNISYSTVPSKGDNVTLNLDNPVYSTSSVSVSGNWTPN